eukprot:Nk52_evm23s307 gene=Nk52_evmTU23s307
MSTTSPRPMLSYAATASGSSSKSSLVNNNNNHNNNGNTPGSFTDSGNKNDYKNGIGDQMNDLPTVAKGNSECNSSKPSYSYASSTTTVTDSHKQENGSVNNTNNSENMTTTNTTASSTSTAANNTNSPDTHNIKSASNGDQLSSGSYNGAVTVPTATASLANNTSTNTSNQPGGTSSNSKKKKKKNNANAGGASSNTNSNSGNAQELQDAAAGITGHMKSMNLGDGDSSVNTAVVGDGSLSEVDVQGIEVFEGADMNNSSMNSSTSGAANNARVFVGGVSWKADENTLREFFRSYGEVVECKIIVDRETGKSKGYGFVTFAKKSVADEVKRLGKVTFLGKPMNVGNAVRKTTLHGGHHHGGGAGHGHNYSGRNKMLHFHNMGSGPGGMHMGGGRYGGVPRGGSGAAAGGGNQMHPNFHMLGGGAPYNMEMMQHQAQQGSFPGGVFYGMPPMPGPGGMYGPPMMGPMGNSENNTEGTNATSGEPSPSGNASPANVFYGPPMSMGMPPGSMPFFPQVYGGGSGSPSNGSAAGDDQRSGSGVASPNSEMQTQQNQASGQFYMPPPMHMMNEQQQMEMYNQAMYMQMMATNGENAQGEYGQMMHPMMMPMLTPEQQMQMQEQQNVMFSGAGSMGNEAGEVENDGQMVHQQDLLPASQDQGNVVLEPEKM